MRLPCAHGLPPTDPRRCALIARTRVTVLAGFLGAGKTTVLNALLRDTTEPLGVIVNDFGAVNVDAALVAGQTSVEGEVALQNGCICCTIRGDLLAALLSLTRRRNPPRHILIEASGVSDPAAIVRTFVDPRISDQLELAAVIGCVDPLEFPRLVGPDWDLASEQLRVCDFVLLTKADLTSAAQRDTVEELVRTRAPRARLLTTSADEVPTEFLLGGDGLWENARIVQTQPRAEDAHVHEVGHDHGHDHAHDHDHAHHHHGVHAFETWTYRTDTPLSAYGLRRVLQRLPASVFRAKGFVLTTEDPQTRLLVQVAGARAELTAHGAWETPPRTELVFLGREGQLDAETLRSQLDAACYAGPRSPQGFLDDMVGHFNRLLSTVPGHKG